MGRKSKEQAQRSKETAYKNAWSNKNRKRFELVFNLNTEADLIRFLESVPNRNDYIRNLILADMKKEQKNEQD